MGAARRGSGGTFSVERSIRGSIDWISSSIGRDEGVLATGKDAGACTGADTWGTRVIGVPHRLQKTDSAGTLLPHFEQNTLESAGDASAGLITGVGGNAGTGLAVTVLRTGLMPSIAVPAGRS